MFKQFARGLLSQIAFVGFLSWTNPAFSQAPQRAAETATIVFNNVKVFDGKSARLTEPMNVLVRGNKIDKISAQPIPTDRRADTQVIDGGGRTLMPGLIDAHWHTMLVRPSPPAAALAWDVGYTNLLAGVEAKETLLRGFTTVRDLGGPAFGLKRAIDEGRGSIPAAPSSLLRAVTATSGSGSKCRESSGARRPAWSNSGRAWSPTVPTRFESASASN